MKSLVAFVVVPMVAAGLSGQADAATSKKKRMPIGQLGAPYENGSRNPMAANGYVGYYERVLNKVPFGSQLWWRVYDSQPRGR